MGIEDHKLKVFCTVAETKSFSKTSEIIHLTQPAVSLQIQALEEMYETKLFDRSGSSINLTTSGEILYKYAKGILTLYAEVEKEISKITALVKGSVKLGAGTTAGNYILPTVIVDFKKKHPKVKVNVLIGNTKRILELLNSGVIDFAVVLPAQVSSKEKLRIEPFITDELGIIVPPAHPWAKKKSVSILDITKEPFVIREEGSGTRDIIEAYLERHGLSVSDLLVVSVLGSARSIVDTVSNGMGISILSRWAVRKDVKCGDLRFISPKEGRITRDFAVVTCKSAVLSPAEEEFISYTKTYPYEDVV